MTSGWSVFAGLNKTLATLNRIHAIVRGLRGIGANSDLRLSRYFGLTKGFWLKLQNAFDLMEAESKSGKAIAKIKPHPISRKGEALEDDALQSGLTSLARSRIARYSTKFHSAPDNPVCSKGSLVSGGKPKALATSALTSASTPKPKAIEGKSRTK